jgi:hypothetical protein
MHEQRNLPGSSEQAMAGNCHRLRRLNGGLLTLGRIHHSAQELRHSWRNRGLTAALDLLQHEAKERYVWAKVFRMFRAVRT